MFAPNIMSNPDHSDDNQYTSPLEQKLDIVVANDTRQASGDQPMLLMMKDGAAGKLYPLDKPVISIGRSGRAEISVNEESVSHRHARLELRDGAWWIEDLGSTNGTRINDEELQEARRLLPGDVIAAGETRFLFVTAGMTNGRALVVSGDVSSPLTYTRAAPRLPTEPRSVAGSFASHSGPISSRDADDGMTLAQLLGFISVAWIYIKRYGWLMVVAASLGVAAGLAHTRYVPPPGSAWFEVTLRSQSEGNPMNQKPDEATFFVAAERTFTSLPLISKTLEVLGRPSGVEQAKLIQKKLKFEQQGYRSQLWRGEYEDRTAESAAAFLGAHMRVYLESETEQALQVIRQQIDFLSTQLHQESRNLGKAEGELIRFREKYPEVRLDDRAMDELKKVGDGVVGRRFHLAKEVQKAESSLAATKQRLGNPASFVAANRAEKAKDFDARIARLDSELSALDAKGYGAGHPDVKRLRAQRSNLLREKQKAVSAPPTPEELKANPQYRDLINKQAQLEERQKAVQSQLSSLPANAPTKEEEAPSLPRLQTELAKLARNLEKAQKGYDQLFEQLKASELQLERERASAKAHYAIITPPTKEPAKILKSAVKRSLIYVGVMVLLALLVAIVIELRRFMRAYHAGNPRISVYPPA